MKFITLSIIVHMFIQTYKHTFLSVDKIIINDLLIKTWQIPKYYCLPEMLVIFTRIYLIKLNLLFNKNVYRLQIYLFF